MIAIAGAGRMGRGIALAMAIAGERVSMVDLKDRPAADAERLLAEARVELANSLRFLVELEVLTDAERVAAAERIGVFANGPHADAEFAAATFVFEGATETLAAKEAVFTRLGALCAPDAIIASTSSTFSADELAGFVAHPGRFLITHWLNPAYLVPIVEMSPGSLTDAAVTQTMKAFLEAAGKMPIVCKDSPGFIVPRLQVVAVGEAARIVAEGVASAEDVDKAIRFGFGFRFAMMGMLEFLDLGGVDILYYAARHMRHALDDERYAAPPIIDELIAAGNLGEKSGTGFYDWSGGGAQRREAILRRIVGLLRHMELLPLAAKPQPDPR